MSTVIIGGGDDARQRITNLETTSLTNTREWCDQAEALLAQFTADCDALITGAASGR